MRLNISTATLFLITLLGTTSTARKLPANEPCATNKACEANCVNGTYYVASSTTNSESGSIPSIFFVCSFDPAPKYATGQCVSTKDNKVTPEDAQVLCDSAEGFFCEDPRNGNRKCAFRQSDQTIRGYRDGCAEFKGKVRVGENLSEEFLGKTCV
ncbi:uncharacterized protein BDV14DRAFT_195831 [Aspergillus stella-maris]|uniref:uncharacterized protein n=1 Tax=Aspergillus stella-maris TaxID=1810926 RepID=UPI003CCDC37A